MSDAYFHRNALARLATILDSLQKVSAPGSGKTKYDAWLEVLKEYRFEFSSSKYENSLELAEILTQFYRELIFAWAEIDAQSGPTSQHEKAFEKVLLILSVHNLSVQWNQCRGALTPEVITIVSFGAQALPAEKPLDTTDIGELKTFVEELAINIQTSELPEHFKRVLLHHVAVIRDALMKYNLMGATALREAIKELHFDVREHAEEFQKHANSEEVEGIKTVWTRITELFQRAKTVEEGVGSLVQIASHLHTTAEIVKNVQG